MTADGPRPEPSSLDTIDPDEWNASRDAAERARAERRAQRAQRRGDRGDRTPRRLRRERPRPERPARHAHAAALLATPSGRLLAGIAGALALFTVVGLVALWPGARPGGPQQAFGGATLHAEVVATHIVRCPGPTPQRCRAIVVKVTEGRDAGHRATLQLGPLNATPALAPGDGVRVQRGGDGPQGYTFADVDRRAPMLWLAIALGVLAVVVARWRGLLALLGVGLSLVLVGAFLIPAILAGSDPVLVSLVAALAVMFVTLLLTYGVGAQSLAAALGIATSLLLAAVVGHAMVGAAHLDGRTGELPVAALGGVSLQGIVLAGMVIGVLGVLTDMAVSQASAVMALREANPQLGPRALYRGAFAVGRDHLSATIHTLVLAYVGAALPLMLILSEGHVGLTDAINVQVVAEPVIATLVGALALVAAVPATTALSAVLVARVPTEALHGHHGHAH
ncbi:MAG: hypothetical protein QOC78_999 [Solirubrobacteraceae bacterium]|jgi:uncharacterized membrane protein|nr:hypothetical protein [Solirubrobacteraceae bacterium]